MIRRLISEKILEYTNHYPVVTVTGPRQSGKTTLCKMLFKDVPYVSLEHPLEREFAQKDPLGFLDQFPDRVVLDEIQRVPDLFSYIQIIVDKSQKMGQFIITGSQNLQLLDTVSQSLAGRTAIARLLPFSLREIHLMAADLSLNQLVYTGGYPGIYDRKQDPTEAHSFYYNTYIERDLRMLINLKDLSRFETFVKLCATRIGQVLNLSSLGNDCGVNHNTIKSWLSLLETSYIIKLLRPFYRNMGKRLIKSPKLYFVDTGLAAYLLGIQEEKHLQTHPLRGHLFENLIMIELLKNRFNQGKTDNLYFLRDSRGHEVDLVLDEGAYLELIEIKSSKTLSQDLFKGLRYFRNQYAETGGCKLIYGGDINRKQYGVDVISWKQFFCRRFS